MGGEEYDCWVDPGYDGSPYYNTSKELADPTYANLKWFGDHGQITLDDVPRGASIHRHIVFEANIVAVNYKGSGRDKVIGSFTYGWNDKGVNPIHGGAINISPTISNTSRTILAKQYSNYKLFGE